MTIFQLGERAQVYFTNRHHADPVQPGRRTFLPGALSDPPAWVDAEIIAVAPLYRGAPAAVQRYRIRLVTGSFPGATAVVEANALRQRPA
jgi:hypothetical protein